MENTYRHAQLPEGRVPALRVEPMPADTNQSGEVFGGWVMSQVDLAGANTAMRYALSRYCLLYTSHRRRIPEPSGVPARFQTGPPSPLPGKSEFSATRTRLIPVPSPGKRPLPPPGILPASIRGGRRGPSGGLPIRPPPGRPFPLRGGLQP